MALLSIEDLTIRFGSRSRAAVDKLSLQIEPGQSLGLVGESGSGKSATALAILRLLDPAAQVEGTIRFNPRAAASDAAASPVDLLTLPSEPMRRLRGSAIGMIFQEPMTSLNPVMPVGEQIGEAIRAHHPQLRRRQVRERTLESMHAVALPDPVRRAGDYPHQFSGGQRQRILIAMALVNRPALLIADEPTTALDVTVQAQILDLLQDLRERYNLAMLFISHDLAVVAHVADHVAVMRGGVLLEQGPADSIFRNPLHSYTRSLLGAIPTLLTPIDRPLATVSSDPGAGAALNGQMRQATPGHWVRLPSTLPSPFPGPLAVTRGSTPSEALPILES
jgi:peptide/nickel transport system ATP-binding protein